MEDKIIQALLNQNNVGIFFARNSKLIYANNACAAIFGYSKAELMTLNFKSLFPFFEISTIMEELTDCQYNFQKRFQFKGLRKDGLIIDLEFNKQCKIISKSTPYIIGLITDENFAYDGLADEELEIIVIKDVNGNIMESNSYYEQMFNLIENGSLYRENCYETDELAWETGVIKFEREVKLKDNRNKIIEVTKIPISNPHNPDRFILIVGREVNKYNTEYLDNKSTIQLLDINLAVDSNSALTVIDSNGIYKFVNNNFCEMMGYSKSELIGNSFINVNSGYHQKEFFDSIWNTVQKGMTWKGDIKSISKMGSLIAANVTIVPVLDATGRPYKYITIRTIGSIDLADDGDSCFIIDNKKNKLAFRDAIEKRINQLEPNTNLSVIIVHIEQFEIVKVIYGEEVAEKLIIQISIRIKERILRNNGEFFRFDDESLGIAFEMKNEREIYEFIGEIMNLAKEKIVIDNNDIYFSFKIGLSLYPLSSKKPDLLIDFAKIALAQAKSNRLQYLIYLPDFADKTLKSFLIKNELHKAIQKNEFILYFQPRVNNLNEVIGAEALLRWDHPELGIIPPATFVSLAEETLLINPIGYWVVEEACRYGKKWHDQGFRNFKISLNISAIQFSQPGFVERIKEIIENTGFNPKYLEFEITESTINDNDLVSAAIKVFKEMGIMIAIDDFGSGYSSYDLLKQYNVDTLKIDRSLISDLNNNIRSINIISSIINLAKLLNINVVAEGVETEEQYSLLHSLNCKEFQGYLFSRPLSVEVFESMMIASRN